LLTWKLMYFFALLCFLNSSKFVEDASNRSGGGKRSCKKQHFMEAVQCGAQISLSPDEETERKDLRPPGSYRRGFTTFLLQSKFANVTQSALARSIARSLARSLWARLSCCFSCMHARTAMCAFSFFFFFFYPQFLFSFINFFPNFSIN